MRISLPLTSLPSFPPSGMTLGDSLLSTASVILTEDLKLVMSAAYGSKISAKQREQPQTRQVRAAHAEVGREGSKGRGRIRMRVPHIWNGKGLGLTAIIFLSYLTSPLPFAPCSGAQVMGSL